MMMMMMMIGEEEEEEEECKGGRGGWRRPSSYLACRKHLSLHGGSGVCASCLRERLVALSSEAPAPSNSVSHHHHHHHRRRRRPFVAAAAAEVDRCDAGSAETIQRLIEADREQCRSSSRLEKERSAQYNDILLGRSVSWSQSKAGSRSSHGPLATSTLPSTSNTTKDRTSRALSALLSQNSATCSAESVATTKIKQQQAKSFSSLFSLSRFRSGKNKAAACSSSSFATGHSKESKGRIESGSAFLNQYSDTEIFEKRIRNEWEGGDADSLYRFDFFKQNGNELPLRVRQVDDQRGGLWKPWATPLRIFKSRKSKQLEEEDAPAIPSGFSYRPSPAPYSESHRQHGSLSLYSSPMPGGNVQRQNSRSELFSFSPYAGANRSWNFYVSPVRPIESTSEPSIFQRIMSDQGRSSLR